MRHCVKGSQRGEGWGPRCCRLFRSIFLSGFSFFRSVCTRSSVCALGLQKHGPPGFCTGSELGLRSAQQALYPHDHFLNASSLFLSSSLLLFQRAKLNTSIHRTQTDVVSFTWWSDVCSVLRRRLEAGLKNWASTTDQPSKGPSWFHHSKLSQ